MVRLPCSRCIRDPPGTDGASWRGWSHVEAELRVAAGELWMAVNRGEWQCVFCGLPTDAPLYPVVALINAAQVKFTHLVGDL